MLIFKNYYFYTKIYKYYIYKYYVYVIQENFKKFHLYRSVRYT